MRGSRKDNRTCHTEMSKHHLSKIHIKCFTEAVGDGDLPMTAMMDAVLKAGYTGVFTAEHFDSKHQLRDMERSAVYMLNRIKAYAES